MKSKKDKKTKKNGDLDKLLKEANKISVKELISNSLFNEDKNKKKVKIHLRKQKYKRSKNTRKNT